MKSKPYWLSCVLNVVFLANCLMAQPADRKIARVFILAGQSNMQGHGVVDLDDEKNYNGGKGTLVQVMEAAKNPKLYEHLRNEDGTWSVRDDVFVRYQTPGGELKTGGLTIGFSAYQGEPHHIGPELQFGHVVGDAFEEPVLLIKTAWGGKSLYEDFRPPSSGETSGHTSSKCWKKSVPQWKTSRPSFPLSKTISW